MNKRSINKSVITNTKGMHNSCDHKMLYFKATLKCDHKYPTPCQTCTIHPIVVLSWQRNL